MKRKQTRDTERTARILAVISEGGNTTLDLVAKKLGTPSQVAGALTRLKIAGKIRQSERGSPWRTDSAGASPPREEDAPKEPAPAKLGANIRGMIVEALRGGPLSRADLFEQIRPHLNGRHEAGIDTAIAGLRRARQLSKADGMYRLGGADAPRARTRDSGEGKPAIIAALYEQRDRIDRAIRILEGKD